MKRLLIPIAIFIILGGAALYLYITSGSGTLKKELSNFAVEDTASVTRIFLADKAGKTILLERVNEGLWQVNGKYEARQEGVLNLLSTIKRLSVKAPVPNPAFETVVKNISSNHVKVEIYQGEGDKPVKVYFVGGPNRAHSGTYMLMENSTVPFLMHIEGFHGYLTPRYFTNENAWRSNIICRYRYGDIASIKVEFPPNPQNSFLITDLGNGAFSLKSLALGQEISDYDTLAVKGYVAGFKKVPYESFEETKPEEFIDSVIHSSPMEIYTITAKNGEITEIKTFLKLLKPGASDFEGNPLDHSHDLDRLYACINNEMFVVVQYYIFDKFDLPFTHFLKNKGEKN